LLKILPGCKIENRESADFLLCVVGELAEERVAVDERTTHGGNSL
jgi:hypothetical protein